MEYKVDEKLFHTVVKTLGTAPYNEIAGLMNKLNAVILEQNPDAIKKPEVEESKKEK